MGLQSMRSQRVLTVTERLTRNRALSALEARPGSTGRHGPLPTLLLWFALPTLLLWFAQP